MNKKNIQCPLKSLPNLSHKSVMLDEIMDYLNLQEGMTVLDATLGLGGHTRAMAERVGETGRVIAFDWDERNIELAKKNLEDYQNIIFVYSPFSQLKEKCQANNIAEISAAVFDLGLSSAHLDDAERGFSFRLTAPLDMRMNTALKQTAADILNYTEEKELADIFWRYGEERLSRKIAAKILEKRKIAKLKTTEDLFAIISELSYNPKKVAARVFQALRIYLNHELLEIETGILSASQILKKNAIMAVLSFHSLEDRIVKNIFRDGEQKGQWKRINKKVILPSENEIKENPRSRSAKLRLIQKT